jgi:hypothetical protein
MRMRVEWWYSLALGDVEEGGGIDTFEKIAVIQRIAVVISDASSGTSGVGVVTAV